MNKSKLILILALIAAIIAFFAFDLGRFFTLDFIKQSQAQFGELYAQKPLQVIGGFFALYVAVTALSLPGAAIMTLAGGAIFGLVVGLIVVSFASTIGATLAFVAARFALGESVQKKFGSTWPKSTKAWKKKVRFISSPCASCHSCRFS